MTNYRQSREILQSIKSAKKILITSHVEPDADSVGSVLGLQVALGKIKISSDVVCRDSAPDYLSFLPGAKNINAVDFSDFEFSEYDVIVVLDSSEWKRVVGSEFSDIKPQAKIIVIDHHKSNVGYGQLNLVEGDATSTSEIICNLIEDWNIKLDKNAATCLLTGIIGDTGSFRFPDIEASTFEIASKLMMAGADRNEIIFNLYFNVDFNELKYLSEILKEAKIDEKNKIVWTAISYSKYKALGKPEGVGFSGMFFQIVKGTELGIYIIEKEKNVVDVSFRARKNLDASKIAAEMGGGGHRKAAGAKLRDIRFEDVVKKVLKVAKKYTK